ncbi:MAG: protein kinase [Planctomycetota bacterium]
MQAEVLIGKGGATLGQRVLAAGGRLLVGSGPEAELRLSDPLVSPRHLALELRPDGLWVTDLDSSTGTTAAGRPLPPGQAVSVPPGTVFEVGTHQVLVRPLAEAPAAGGAAGGAGGGGMRADYEQLGELGQGAMGTVFRARHRASGRIVAVKMLREQVDAVTRERFLREGEVTRRIQSPHVVQVYEVRVEGPVAYLVMELVEGGSLRDLALRGPAPIPTVIAAGEAIARGLQAAHAAGVIHRDVKPANVLVTPDGQVKVADFGLAKDSGSAAQLTRTREGMGTLAYLAPEQAEDSKRVDARADVYSLGALLYHLVSGRLPFDGAGMEVLAQLFTEEPPPLSEVRPDCPEPLARLIHWMLEKDPDDRPPTAELVAQQLAALR